MSTARRKPRDYRFFGKFSWYQPGVGGMFGLFAWLLVGTLLGAMVTMAFGAIYTGESALEYSMLVSYPVQFIPAMLYAASRSRVASMNTEGRKLDSNNFGKAGGLVCALVAVVSTLAMGLCAELPTMILPPVPDALKSIFEGMTQGSIWANLLCVSVFAPFFEEWLCRGMVLRGLLGNGMKPVWAIAVSGLFFALIHMNPWQAVPAFMLGCLFGYVYYRTGSLKLTMLMHCTNNTFAVICGNIDSLKEMDSWKDVLPAGIYWVMVAAALLLVVLSVRLYSKIELKSEEGNLDKVPSFFDA